MASLTLDTLDRTNPRITDPLQPLPPDQTGGIVPSLVPANPNPMQPGTTPGMMYASGNDPAQPVSMTTGGNTPPAVATPVVNTGGNQPPVLQPGQPAPNGNTGIVPPYMQTGGNLPPQTQMQPLTTTFQLPSIPMPTWQSDTPLPPPPQPTAATPAPQPQSITDMLKNFASQFKAPDVQDPSKLTMGYLNDVLSSGGSYMTNALRNGLSVANNRGLLNSSLAAGTAQKSAIEASMPILNQIMNLNNQREGQNFSASQNQFNAASQFGMQREGQDWQSGEKALDRGQNDYLTKLGMWDKGNQAALDRNQQTNLTNLNAYNQMQNDLLRGQITAQQSGLEFQYNRAMQTDTTAQQDWLNNQSFTRQFNANLSTMPLASAMDFSKLMSQYAIEDPEVYTPAVVSGMTNFLTQNMFSILGTYFPSMINTNTGGTP